MSAGYMKTTQMVTKPRLFVLILIINVSVNNLYSQKSDHIFICIYSSCKNAYTSSDATSLPSYI